MNAGAALTLLWPLGCGLLAGVLAGVLHFHLLARNVRLFTAGRVGPGLLLQSARLAATGTVLVALARLGAGAVLAGAVGVLLARHRALRRAGSEAS